MASGRHLKRTTIQHVARKSLGKYTADAIDTLHTAASNGDVMAARAIIELVIPKPRTESLPLELQFAPGIMTTMDYARCIESHMMAGEISASIASEALEALKKIADLTIMSEFESRLAALESGNTITVESRHVTE